jgi:hypothetical protein
MFDEEGANATLIEARKSGQAALHRIHRAQDPHLHLKAPSRSRAWLQIRHRADAAERDGRALSQLRQAVLPELVKRNIGVLGMKSMANGINLKSKTVTPVECLHYALNLATSVVITGIDSQEILNQAFEAVRPFRPMSKAQVIMISRFLPTVRRKRNATDNTN